MPNGHQRQSRAAITARAIGGLFLLLVLPVCLASCRDQRPAREAAPPQRLRLALAIQPASSLAILADELGFWRQAGLEVKVTKYISGQQALNQGLFQGNSDAATTADIPVAVAVCERDDFTVVAKIGQIFNGIRIVARRDRAIRRPADLRGKRLGCKKGSVTHYFLELFLMRQAIQPEETQIVSLEADTVPQALREGGLDGAAMREPYLGQALRLLGGQGVVFEEPALLPVSDLLVVNRKFLREHPEGVTRLLRGLLSAERFLAEHPLEAQRILARYFDLAIMDVSDKAGGRQLAVSLDHSLVLALEEQTGWVVKKGLSKSARPANLLPFIDQGPLTAARSAEQ